jgi:hypothetical protein
MGKSVDGKASMFVCGKCNLADMMFVSSLDRPHSPSVEIPGESGEIQTIKIIAPLVALLLVHLSRKLFCE